MLILRPETLTWTNFCKLLKDIFTTISNLIMRYSTEMFTQDPGRVSNEKKMTEGILRKQGDHELLFLEEESQKTGGIENFSRGRLPRGLS